MQFSCRETRKSDRKCAVELRLLRAVVLIKVVALPTHKPGLPVIAGKAANVPKEARQHTSGSRYRFFIRGILTVT